MDTTNRGLAALRALGVVQTQIASEVGVTQQSVSAWLRGKSVPGREATLKLERRFGISSALWDGATAPAPAPAAKPARKPRARKPSLTRTKAPGTARARGAPGRAKASGES